MDLQGNATNPCSSHSVARHHGKTLPARPLTTGYGAEASARRNGMGEISMPIPAADFQGAADDSPLRFHRVKSAATSFGFTTMSVWVSVAVSSSVLGRFIW